MTILVTGGAGFIGSNFVTSRIHMNGTAVVNLDKLTYAGNLANLSSLVDDRRHIFVKGDVCDRGLVRDVLAEYRPRAIVHLAAESHVDRSIESPDAFIASNVNGTFCLLDAVQDYLASLPMESRATFRFLHVSTDEVYGELDGDAPPVKEGSACVPSSPYAASKAAADHLVAAYHRTYGLPALIARCCNNYGPCQFPEKLIPRMIVHAVRGLPLPIYGDGGQRRDWLHVSDTCAALSALLDSGVPGEIYNISGNHELTNLMVVRQICSMLDCMRPRSRGSHRDLIRHVSDRPGHDRRYAMNREKLTSLCGWRPVVPFENGLRITIEWYLENATSLVAATGN